MMEQLTHEVQTNHMLCALKMNSDERWLHVTQTVRYNENKKKGKQQLRKRPDYKVNKTRKDSLTRDICDYCLYGNMIFVNMK